MTMRITQWSPDTCDCVLSYSWDDEVPSDQRVHSPHSMTRACPAHSGRPVAAHFSEVLGENQHKNYSLGQVMQTLRSTHVQVVTQEDGTQVDQWKPGYEP